ncbi:MAG: ATP-grasp domain-containing protein [Rhizonema sp. PD38]|nr:ATP-grasp domain-containing protein [Rhizonema sp. PD38]
MSILLFNRSHAFDYANWLADSGQDLILFSDRVIREMHKYRAVKIFPCFDNSGLSELCALELRHQIPFSRVIGHSEYDLIRAAHLRAVFSLPGQNIESATSYRNKFLMKEYASKAGIPVAQQTRIDSPVQLLIFIEQHGLPVVVKPLDGGGSRGVEVLQDQKQVREFVKTLPNCNYMVESFVSGQLYHIDGLARDGKICFATSSNYFSEGCLNFHTSQSNGSYLLESDSLLHYNLVQFTQGVIDALPASPELGFHAEAFVQKDGKIVLCEIAARTAGGWIIESIDLAYGINLNREWVRLSAGIDETARLCNLRVQRQAGFLIFPPQSQAASHTPQIPPFDWCRSCINDISKYVNGGNAAGSVEFASMMLVEGSSSQQVRERLHELDRWLNKAYYA